MQLQAGQKLGPFEIAAPLGAGGMGEVFRAVDTRLGRSVAIKVLPARLTADPDRRARFEREARLISSLNHPHICALFDVRSDEGVDYLVMELVEGRSLAVQLVSGPLPIAETLHCGAQIASALAAAHRKGVVHRDLKPGNIVMGKSGAKLLDFGLATVEPRPAAADDSTATMALTDEHTIVGTLQYMAPEQLEGGAADPRSDIFSFGAVLYEMVTGRRAFEGTSNASLIGAIMTAEPPPASTVQPATPPALDRTIRQCLAKDPEDRWQDAADLARELAWLGEAGSQAGVAAIAAPRKRRREYVAWAVAGLCFLLVGALGVALYRIPHPEPQMVRFNLPDPPGTTPSLNIPMVSADGTKVVVAAQTGTQLSLWIHHLTAGEFNPVPGTEGASGAIWGPDNRTIAFPRKGHTYLFDLQTGAERDITMEAGAASTGTVGEGLIVFCIAKKGLWAAKVDSADMMPRHVAPYDAAVGDYVFPAILPGGHSVLVTGTSRFQSGVPVFRINLETGAREALPIVSSAQVAYSPSGHIVYVSRDMLVAQPFDAGQGKPSGSAVPLTGPVSNIPIAPYLRPFSISNNGVLAFRGGSMEQSRPTWYSRNGEVLGTVGQPGDYSSPDLSRDGSRLAVGLRDAATRTRDIWIFDLVRNASARRTTDPADDMNPVFSPDGERFLFTSDRDGKRTIFASAVQGGEESRVFSETASVEDWSADGRFASYNRSSNGVWAVPLEGGDRKPLLVDDRPGAGQSKFSSDGKWLAFVATDLGRMEVFVGSFPPTVWKVRVSVKGGTKPQWRRDGKELYYMEGNRLMAVPISTSEGKLLAGAPAPMFEAPLRPLDTRNRYVAAPDGNRFLLIIPIQDGAMRPITVIVNWPALLRLPTVRPAR